MTIKTRPCVNSAHYKDGKIVCEKRQSSTLEENEPTISLGLFGKIKDFFLCYLERLKWAKFKRSGLLKAKSAIDNYFSDELAKKYYYGHYSIKFPVSEDGKVDVEEVFEKFEARKI